MAFMIVFMLLQVFTALSFLLFSRENVDIAIVEVSYGKPYLLSVIADSKVRKTWTLQNNLTNAWICLFVSQAGLGGARDATNVIKSTQLAASVITTVGREHLAALGGSLQSIAIAKSGIIKGGRPVM